MTTNEKSGLVGALEPQRRGYSILLVALISLWILAPILDLFGREDIGDVVLVSVCLIAASYVMRGKGVRFIAVVALGAVLAAIIWINLHSPLPGQFLIVSSVVGALFFGAVAVELLLDILSTGGKVTMTIIHGAIAVYLLIGVGFSFVFSALFTLDPHSFKGLAESGIGHDKFTYFSFVTLTTLGYGDVSPVSRMAEAAATLEAAIGQLYLTVLVARLVGMQISQQPAD